MRMFSGIGQLSAALETEIRVKVFKLIYKGTKQTGVGGKYHMLCSWRYKVSCNQLSAQRVNLQTLLSCDKIHFGLARKITPEKCNVTNITTYYLHIAEWHYYHCICASFSSIALVQMQARYLPVESCPQALSDHLQDRIQPVKVFLLNWLNWRTGKVCK